MIKIIKFGNLNLFMLKTEVPLMIKVSKVISNFFNPLTSLFIYFIYFSSITYTFKEAFHIFLPILLLAIAPITFWISYHVRKGKYTNMDVSNRNQRKSLYFFIGAVLITYLFYNYFVNHNFDLFITFIMILLFVMQISNYFIKSSMHTAFNVFVAALFFSINPYLGIFWLGIAILVGVTRVILKRHTVKEVFTGAAIAVLVSFIYLYTNIQLHH